MYKLPMRSIRYSQYHKKSSSSNKNSTSKMTSTATCHVFFLRRTILIRTQIWAQALGRLSPMVIWSEFRSPLCRASESSIPFNLYRLYGMVLKLWRFKFFQSTVKNLEKHVFGQLFKFTFSIWNPYPMNTEFFHFWPIV